MNYLDFELEIGPGVGQEYPVAVIRSPAGEARETMRFPYDEIALESRLDKLRIALLQSGSRFRRVLSPEQLAIQDFGQDLFNALLVGDVRNRYDVSQSKAIQHGEEPRSKLRGIGSLVPQP